LYDLEVVSPWGCYFQIGGLAYDTIKECDYYKNLNHVIHDCLTKLDIQQKEIMENLNVLKNIEIF